jgi:quercetin dioxygenase-like cupin family protein
MTNILLIKEIDLAGTIVIDKDKDKEVNKLFDGPFRTLIEVRLQNGAVLSKHKATEPITVLCLSGRGVFRAGSDLEDAQDLRAGILITLEAAVEHEVVADPEIHILVTKFKDS